MFYYLYMLSEVEQLRQLDVLERWDNYGFVLKIGNEYCFVRGKLK